MRRILALTALLAILASCGKDLPEAGGESVPRVENQTGSTGAGD